ncbi:fused MFS/spermidine synthase [Rhodocyclaceae bacterium]
MQLGATPHRKLGLLGLAFLASGAAGLIYQVAWQRLLFASFGVDLVSVSIIVSTFMLGLGLGALAGGWLGDRFPAKTLQIFVLCEIIIGSFGLLSPGAIRSLALLLTDASFITTAAANFLLMLIPTFFMGATLPVLIAYLVRLWKNVGAATGHLYALNTLGAMLGSSLTAFWLFHFLELDQTIRLAAAINFSVALSVWLTFKGSTK